jgi:hypothetical protein
MGFAAYLRNFIERGQLIVEADQNQLKQPPVIDYNAIKNQIESKIGGDPNEKNSLDTSFEAIEKTLDSIPLDYLENPEAPHLGDIFELLTKDEPLEFIEKFTEKKKKDCDALIDFIDTLDRDREQTKFVQYLKDYTNISERLLKIYRLFAGQTGALTEAVDLSPEKRAKVDKIMTASKAGAGLGFKKILDQEKKNIDSIPETPDGANILFKYKDLIEFLGLAQFLKNAIKEKEEKIEKKEPKDPKTGSIKNKKRIIDTLIKAINLASLPVMSNDQIEKAGDHYQLFRALMEKDPAWMKSVLESQVFNDDPARIKEFEVESIAQESAKEENQLTYLKASSEWIAKYIDSRVDGDLSERDTQNLKSSLNTAVTEREKDIKNYYLSREFNLGNFGGIQLKPEIRLPLYTKVKLAVSEEDRKKESPLRNILKGLGMMLGGLFSAIPDRGNEQVAKAAYQRNVAIFRGLNAIVQGTVTVVGGKQAGRDYAAAINKTFSSKKEGKLREDMLSVADSPGFVAVNPESPGQIMQTPGSLAGGMDTFSLLGPGKKTGAKKKKSKAKKTKPTNSVPSFADFIQRK